MNILFIGPNITHKQYLEGAVPSHWLYGAVEMEREGHNVFWKDEKTIFFNDIYLIKQYSPDIVFIPNLNMCCHLFILILSVLGIVSTPIFTFLHHEPKFKNKMSVGYWLYLLSLRGCKHIFFLSEVTMENTINYGYAKLERCSAPGWGPNIDFYSKVKISDRGYFVSTGKENRDFDILIEAFKRTGAQLKIMTAKSHAGNNHEYLIEACKDIPNIEVVITENTGDVFPQMLEAMANAKALVCPLRKDKLNYCVGLSTIADAEGLRKPLIITRNPYHNTNRMKYFHVVESVDDWVEAIEDILRQEDSVMPVSEYSMQKCWENMKPFML